MHSSAHSERVRHVPTISASLFFFNFPQAPSIVHHFCRPSAVTELHALYSRYGDHDRQSVFETSAGRLSICGLERSLKSHDVYRIPPPVGHWPWEKRTRNGLQGGGSGPKESRKESEVFLRGIPDSVAETVVSRFSFLVSCH